MGAAGLWACGKVGQYRLWPVGRCGQQYLGRGEGLRGMEKVFAASEDGGFASLEDILRRGYPR